MRFFEGMFGRNPEQEKPPETAADTAIAVADQLEARASNAPPASRHGRFMRSAALLGLLVAGEAKAIPNIELLHEQLAQLEHELDLARQDERHKEVRYENLKRTSRYRTMGEALPGDIDLVAAKNAEQQAEKKVEKLEKLVADRKEEINTGAKEWTEKRERQGKVVNVFGAAAESEDVSGAAKSNMEMKMRGWGIADVKDRPNIIAVPMSDGVHFKWIVADERYTKVAFYTPSSNELRLVYQETDMSYDAVIITYDKKLGKGVFASMIVSDREGNPVR